MKIKVGEYVRIKNHGIAKLIKRFGSEKQLYLFDKLDEDCWSGDLENVIFECFLDEEIEDHSFNIMDLIEEGDYINGYKVLDIDFKNEMICLLMSFDEENKSKYNIVWNTKYFIKSIVTKEMFQNIEYRVENN